MGLEKKYILLFFLTGSDHVIPPTNILHLFPASVLATSRVSPTFASLSNLTSLEKRPPSSTLDHAVICCVPVRTHRECRPCTHAASPAVCSGYTMRSEECCYCRTLFLRLQHKLNGISRSLRSTWTYASELPVSHLAWRADRLVRSCRWTGHAAPLYVGPDESQGQCRAKGLRGGLCMTNVAVTIIPFRDDIDYAHVFH